MTDKEKFEKLKKLADAMYYAAQQLTTDASSLHKAMDEYHKFIIHECKEEPVSEEWVEELRAKLDSLSKEDFEKVWGKYGAEEKEEPVNKIDFEQELYKYFGQVKDFTLGMRIAKRFYEIGRNHQEPVSEDLEKELSRLLKDCEIDSEYIHQDFLNIVANHFADWQKQQMLAKAVDVTIAIPYQNGYGGYTQLLDSKEGLPFGEKVKVLVIKED